MYRIDFFNLKVALIVSEMSTLCLLFLDEEKVAECHNKYDDFIYC